MDVHLCGVCVCVVINSVASVPARGGVCDILADSDGRAAALRAVKEGGWGVSLCCSSTSENFRPLERAGSSYISDCHDLFCLNCGITNHRYVIHVFRDFDVQQLMIVGLFQHRNLNITPKQNSSHPPNHQTLKRILQRRSTAWNRKSFPCLELERSGEFLNRLPLLLQDQMLKRRREPHPRGQGVQTPQVGQKREDRGVCVDTTAVLSLVLNKAFCYPWGDEVGRDTDTETRKVECDGFAVERGLGVGDAVARRNILGGRNVVRETAVLVEGEDEEGLLPLRGSA